MLIQYRFQLEELSEKQLLTDRRGSSARNSSENRETYAFYCLRDQFARGVYRLYDASDFFRTC
jgi:hypothetical protein